MELSTKIYMKLYLNHKKFFLVLYNQCQEEVQIYLLKELGNILQNLLLFAMMLGRLRRAKRYGVVSSALTGPAGMAAVAAGDDVLAPLLTRDLRIEVVSWKCTRLSQLVAVCFPMCSG